jgi:hypothetical protein
MFYALATISIASGCSSQANQCNTDADCPGGVCISLAATRECRPLANGDMTVGEGDGGQDLGFTDGPPILLDALEGDAIAASCTMNNDGVIDRSEAPFLVGLGALFVSNTPGTTVAVNEQAVNNTWDFTAAVSGEQKVFDQLLSPSGTWWQNSFPNATYAQRLEDGQSILGVYQATNDSLQLLGLVSEQSGVQQTLLTYATPIDVLKFPLSTSSTWTSQSDLSGTAQGVIYAGHDQYDFAVDARGTTKVPASQFDTLRLRINYTQTVGFATTTRITYLHMAECYGAVARVRSQDNETSNSFTQAAEYRRLSSP